MKKIVAASLMALTVGTTAATADVKVGLGFGVDALSSLSGLFYGETGPVSSIRVPIDFDFGLRIEPDLLIGTEASEEDAPGGGTEERDSSTVGLGIGAYYTIWKHDKLDFYAGGRLGFASYNHDVSYKNSGLNDYEYGANRVSLRGTFAAEYYFIDNMSFAAQVGLEVYHDEGTGDHSDEEANGMGTTSSLVLRYFF
jgi:hypothetical protein